MKEGRKPIHSDTFLHVQVRIGAHHQQVLPCLVGCMQLEGYSFTTTGRHSAQQGSLLCVLGQANAVSDHVGGVLRWSDHHPAFNLQLHGVFVTCESQVRPEPVN